MQQKVYLFIGPPSSGKSYLGRKFAEYRGYKFYEADDDYTQEYSNRTEVSNEEKKSVYEEFYNIVIEKTKVFLRESGNSVVVASAIGKRRNRDRFREAFGRALRIVYIKSTLKDLLNNAIKYEFPSIEGVERLKPTTERKTIKHLKKKYRSYEKPEAVITIDNDYTDKGFRRLVETLT